METAIRGASTTYPNGVKALRGVTLPIAPGLYGLLGPNGVGASPRMCILATLREPDAGMIRLVEMDVVFLKDEVRNTLGFLPQAIGLNPKVSAERLLGHFAAPKGLTER